MNGGKWICVTIEGILIVWFLVSRAARNDFKRRFGPHDFWRNRLEDDSTDKQLGMSRILAVVWGIMTLMTLMIPNEWE